MNKKFWTKEELYLLKKNHHKKVKEISELLGRTPIAIEIQMSRLRSKGHELDRIKKGFSTDQISFIKKNIKMPVIELALQLNKSVSGVSNQIEKLKKKNLGHPQFAIETSKKNRIFTCNRYDVCLDEVINSEFDNWACPLDCKGFKAKL